MYIVEKSKYPHVFVDNDQLTDSDKSLFERMLSSDISGNERTFFQNMKEKEEHEFAPSADVLIDEHDNADEIYVIRYYYDEYKIGRGVPGKRSKEYIYKDCLSDALEADLFPLLHRHVTLFAWLKEKDFNGINYNGNAVFNLRR